MHTAQLWMGTGRNLWEGTCGAVNTQGKGRVYYKYLQGFLLMGEKAFQIFKLYLDIGRKSHEGKISF